MSDIIQFRRGPRRALPEETNIGEPLFCTDTNELYIGTVKGPQLIGSVKTIDCGIFGDTSYDPNYDHAYDGGTF